MPGAKRRIDPAVGQQLLDHPYRFEFFQAVRVIEKLFARHGVSRTDVHATRLRYDNSLSLAFPSAEIEALQVQWMPARAEGVGPDAAPTPHEIRLTPAFIGLLGHAGALPLSYTERLAERETFKRDRSARAFLDIFNQRAVALFYAGWRKNRPELQYESDGETRFMPLLMALAGLGLPSNRHLLSDGEGGVFDQTIAHYAGALHQRPVSALVMQRVLADYFAVPLRVEQFAGAWYPVPAEQRTRLGRPGSALGAGALAGERIHQRHLRLRLWIGPLTRSRFDDFLPGASGARALARWLGLLGGASFEYEIRLVLRAEDVRGASLGTGGRLGFDTFLTAQTSAAPRDDTGYLIEPLH